MSPNQPVRSGGILTGHFNKLLALVGISWLSSMVIIRYVVKPYRIESRMKENENLMNKLYEEKILSEKMENN